MSEISAAIRLRPTRIGFLVRPTDMASVSKIMRACTCLWGGIYNPIIPVFRAPPREWRRDKFERIKGLGIARGYIKFFEPDVYVESKRGLLEQAGLGAIREIHGIHEHVLPLAKFLAPFDHRDWSEPAFGLCIIDVLRHLYETEQRFQLRDKRPSILVKPHRGDGLIEAVFGAFPRQRDAAYIARSYKDVFSPNELEAGPAAWLEVFRQGAVTPLRVTQYGIDSQRFWYHDLLVYVFDPTRPTDLIDLWNLRLEPHPVLPVPIDWFEALADYLCKVIEDEYRPIRGNPQGLMHHATVEFGRSIGKDRADSLIKLLTSQLPKGALAVKHWRNRIWEEHTNERIHRDARMEITAEEQRLSLSVDEDREMTTGFESLYPKFASRFGAPHSRWVNAVGISAFGAEKIATVLPFNTFDRRWPRLDMFGELDTVGSEGWIFSQRYKNWTETLMLLTKEDTIIGSLDRFGIKANLSDPGHIAKQMLDHLGGLRGVQLLADLETLRLLNKMAGGLRRVSNEAETIEETFERRSAPVKDWVDLLERRKRKGLLPRLELTDFTSKNVIRLGLETDCPHCQFTNWHSLTAVDYDVTCERCLNRYDFPQAKLRSHDRNWHFRVVGPFSVPDYGRGSYSALLTLRVLEKLNGARAEMTSSTAMKLSFDGVDAEVDLVAWWRKERHDSHDPPVLVIGETKSLGQGDLIKERDLDQLRAVGQKLPGAIIVIAVLRGEFTDAEKKLLQSFVKWGRRSDHNGRPTNPVILLTANELLYDQLISATWKELGKPYVNFTDYEHTRNLYNFAEATQRIYLAMPSYFEQRDT